MTFLNVEGTRASCASFFARSATQYKISKSKYAVSIRAVTLATERTNACVAAW